MLAATELSKSYDALRVLDRVSFSVPQGQLVAMVGPSGCGKTTLLNLLARLDEPDHGTIDIVEESRVAYMMQDALLLPWRTLGANALLGVEVASGKTLANRVLVDKCSGLCI